ncbi:adenylate/guanylate cyclase domain-containing protein [Oxalobacteraceae bacterium OM1]|nr:adenylate/guanylate cyclase domain-containing protein [Oxalobacteraceae bacterium OM1]
MKLPAALLSAFRSANAVRFLIALCAVLLTAWAQWSPPPASSFLPNEWLRDAFIRLRASDAPERRVVVVDIDEGSLARVGPWPWPRERLADLAEKLIGPYEARGVALDLVFPERGSEAGDLRLAMLAQHGPLVLAQAFDYETREEALHQGVIGGSTALQVRGAPAATGYIGNHPGLAGGRHFGNIGFLPDRDGTIRRLPMATRYEDKTYPTLSLALVQCCSPLQALAPRFDGVQRVPYERHWDAYTVIPAASILDGTAPLDLLIGKLVLVGSSSLGLTDRVATPLDPSTPGVLVHAAEATRLLDAQSGRMPMRLPGQAIAVLFTFVVALASAFFFPRLSAALNLGWLALASVAWLALAYWLAPHDPDLSTTGPLGSILLLLAVGVPYDWQLTQTKSRKLLDTLRQYVAQAVVDELLRRNLEDPLAPQQLHVTTLIADMEGYTHQVEALSMDEAAQLTRDFLDCLTRPVMELQGTLDKYTGDGLVAFWGAPLPVEDHADRALDAACKILKEVQRFSARREEKGFPPLRVRIGIESGVAMAGDFGTSFRSIYTAVGDSVNTASRLEQVARDYPHSVIVGDGAVQLSKRHRFVSLGSKMLRGKEKPTGIFTIDPEELAA